MKLIDRLSGSVPFLQKLQKNENQSTTYPRKSNLIHISFLIVYVNSLRREMLPIHVQRDFILHVSLPVFGVFWPPLKCSFPRMCCATHVVVCLLLLLLRLPTWSYPLTTTTGKLFFFLVCLGSHPEDIGVHFLSKEMKATVILEIESPPHLFKLLDVV